MYGLDRNQPTYMGRAETSPCEQCPSLFTCYMNSWGMTGMEQEKKEREKGWPAVAVIIGGVAGGDRQQRWLFAVATTTLFFLFSLSLLCFSFSSLLLLLLFFRYSPSVLLSLFFSPLSSVQPLSLYFFLFPSPVFIGKNKGGRPGRPLCYHPSITWKVFFWPSWVGRHLLREKWRWKAVEEKSSSSFASRVVQNGIVWVFFLIVE